MVQEYRINLEKRTNLNRKYRKILFTTPELQLVVMSIPPNQDIGMEEHFSTQFFRVEKGTAIAKIVRPDGTKKRYTLKAGSALIVPTGFQHNIINNSNRKHLKLYTIYSPPVH